MNLRNCSYRPHNPWIDVLGNLFFLSFSATWTVYFTVYHYVLFAVINLVLVLVFTGLLMGAIAEVRRRRRRLAR
jgi:hypothetical protein